MTGTPRSYRTRLGCAGLAVGLVITVASCGSRTGLFVGEVSVDASFDSVSSADAAPDVTPCVPGEFELELATASIMFVLDRSGSMDFALDSNTFPPPGEQTRWEVLRDAMFLTILPFDGQMAMGAKFYPEPNDGSGPEACTTASGISIAPALGNSAAILDVFQTTQPKGGTPTSEAVRIAADDLESRRTALRTIVVATDGAPNCNAAIDPATCTCTTQLGTDCSRDFDGQRCLDGDRAIATIRDVAERRKIPVYVIGIGNLEAPEFSKVLDEMALAGGRPRPSPPYHYSVQTAGEMRAAFTTIRDSIAKCTYLTPSSPDDPDMITVEIDGAEVVRDETRRSGWDWVDKEYGQLAFFGTACERAQNGTPRITGVVSCEP